MLNHPISQALSGLRHTDQIVIGDVGLPVPLEVVEIDISLKIGTPSFIEVLEEILKDMKIEKIILAEEIKEDNPEQLTKISDIIELGDVDIEFIGHEQFKKLTVDSKAIIRTGEATPYSNIILQSAVIF